MHKSRYKRERKALVAVMLIIVAALIALFAASGRPVYLWAILIALAYLGIVLVIVARRHRAELDGSE